MLEIHITYRVGILSNGVDLKSVYLVHIYSVLPFFCSVCVSIIGDHS